jgi:hypothetical protein
MLDVVAATFALEKELVDFRSFTTLLLTLLKPKRHLQQALSTDRRESNGLGDNFWIDESHQMVLRAVLGAKSESGIHVSEIAQVAGGELEEVSAALEVLLENGLVFTTVDESHFKAIPFEDA